jgi:hypothetical protein
LATSCVCPRPGHSNQVQFPQTQRSLRSRDLGGSAQLRQSATSFTNRLAAARARAWSQWRGTTAQQQKGAIPGLGNFGSTTRTHGRGGASWRRGGWRTTPHTGNHCAHGSVTERTAVTVRSPRSLHARSGHGAHATITARTLRSRRTQRTWRARFNHCALWSQRALRSLHARLARCTYGAARQALWTGQAQRPLQRD